jgi:hypothetical protein
MWFLFVGVQPTAVCLCCWSGFWAPGAAGRVRRPVCRVAQLLLALKRALMCRWSVLFCFVLLSPFPGEVCLAPGVADPFSPQ